MTRHILLILLLPAALAASAFSITDSEVNDMLRRLDSELGQRSRYVEQRTHRIDSLNRVMARNRTHDRRWLLDVERLADEYNSFNNDSAIYHYNAGYRHSLEHGDDSLATMFLLKMSMYLPLAGFNQQAEEMYAKANVDSMPADWRDLKILYYDAGRQMNSYLAAFFINYPDMHERYTSQSMEAQSKLLDLLDPHSTWYKLNLGEYYFNKREYSKAKAILLDLIEELPEDDNIYARATHILSAIAKARGDHNEFVYYLTLSAIADTKGATLEVVSLQELGQLLYDMNDVGRAYLYLSTALRNAVECHASMRMMQTAEAMPIIENAHKMELDRSRHRVYIIIAVLALLLLALATALLMLRRDISKMRRMRMKLEDANHIKDVYLSQFLNLCSIYMDKLNQFCKIANRKISTGNVDDLYKITKSGKFVEEQSKDFYDVFDNAFLHIYPTFVADVNKLLRPEERIELRDDELLNTDLRILAFMRLGISESARIAQVLNYSVYTIYAYRNKLKNRAIDRESFDRDVMKIGAIGV